jgi:hypothetical protein
MSGLKLEHTNSHKCGCGRTFRIVYEPKPKDEEINVNPHPECNKGMTIPVSGIPVRSEEEKDDQWVLAHTFLI